MDREEYFAYSLETPSRYREMYGRSIEDIPQEELRTAMLRYDQQLQERLAVIDREEQDARYYARRFDDLRRQVDQFEEARRREIQRRMNGIWNEDGRVAQLDVQRSSKPKDGGSNPPTPTSDRLSDLMIEDEDGE